MVFPGGSILSYFYSCHSSYRHLLHTLEVNLRRQISGMLNVLAWIHLIDMNIGGPLTTLLMIFAGLSGSGVLSIFTEGKKGPQNWTYDLKSQNNHIFKFQLYYNIYYRDSDTGLDINLFFPTGGFNTISVLKDGLHNFIDLSNLKFNRNIN